MPVVSLGPEAGGDSPPASASPAAQAVGSGGSFSSVPFYHDSPGLLPQPPSHAAFASPETKVFLGGYRNKATGQEYHHAATQTEPEPRAEPAQPRPQRTGAATQTDKPRRSCAVQCVRDAATQCPRPGWVEDRMEGRVVKPTAPYVTAEQVAAQRTAAAVAVQRHARGWLARRSVAALRIQARKTADEIASQAAQQEAAAEARRQFEVQRRMQPRTQADFVLLYDELAMWWGHEQAKIAAAGGVTDGERQDMRRALLAKETKLLQTIDRLKLAAAPVVRAERAARQMAASAAPRHWDLGGRVLQVATPATLRAGELAGAYHALLAADGTNLDARLAALLAVKYHAKGVDCSLTREIVGLVDREADLLNRGRDPAMMSGLRTRLANRFLEFVREQSVAPVDEEATVQHPHFRRAAAAVHSC